MPARTCPAWGSTLWCHRSSHYPCRRRAAAAWGSSRKDGSQLDSEAVYTVLLVAVKAETVALAIESPLRERA
eukprot:4876251-Prymnesium_polylepis.1